MNTASAYGGLAPHGGAPELKQRLSKALLDVSGSLVGAKAGALVQVSLFVAFSPATRSPGSLQSR